MKTHLRAILFSVLIVGVIFKADADQKIISTVVGNHSLGGTFTGDGGDPLSAGLSMPGALYFDSQGNLWIADSYNAAVRVVANGVITSPVTGYFSWPCGIAMDANQNLFIANADTDAILEFLMSDTPGYYVPEPIFLDQGTIFPPQSLGMDAAGFLYFVGYGQNAVFKTDTSGNFAAVAGNGQVGYSGDGGSALSASLSSMQGYFNASASVTPGTIVDSQGNLYIADTGNNVVRKVDGNGTITTIAGNGQAGYSGDGGSATSATLFGPTALAVDAQGNVYIADSGNNVVREVDVNGTITTIAGNGQAGFTGDGGFPTYASLNTPGGLALDAAGNLYISDTGNNVIREIMTAPDSVTLTISCRPNRIVLNWDISSGLIGHVAHFVIKRATSQNGQYVDIAALDSGQQYVDTAVTAGVTYYYKIEVITDTSGVLLSNIASSSTCQTPVHGPTDVVFIIDNTGSMGGSLNSIKTSFASILQDIITASGGDYRLALLTPDSGLVDVRVNFSPGNVSAFSAALSGLTAGGGGQTPESTDQCLNTVVNALADDAHGRTDTEGCLQSGSPLQIHSFAPAFRADANKLVVLVTDASPGGFCDSTRPPAIPHSYAAEASVQGIQINAILVNDNAADFSVAYPFMQDYAITTCGWFSVVTTSVADIKDAVLRMVYGSGACPGSNVKPPVANPQIVVASEAVAQDIVLTGSDPNGLSLQYILLSSPTHGTLTGTPPNLTYTANTDYNGPDTFTFKVNNGTLDSLPATVSINVVGTPPEITQQPANVTVQVGNQASFVVVVSGTSPLSYQWFDQNGTALTDGSSPRGGATVSGANTATLTLSGVQLSDSGAGYYVVVSNPTGSATSSTAILALGGLPQITLQPVDKTVIVNATATFTVTASGPGSLTYQWFDQYNDMMGNGNPTLGGAIISGATTSTLTLTGAQLADSGIGYYVVVSNPNGSASSSTAILTVANPLPPHVVNPPVSQIAPVGGTAIFKVTIDPSAPTTTFSWYKNGQLISGQNNPSLILQNVSLSDSGSTYYVSIQNPYGTTSTISTPATLTVVRVPLPPVVFTPTGSKSSPTVVKLSVPGFPNATIRYTIDGSIPNSSSTVYNPASPLNLTVKKTVSAYATSANNDDSGYTVATFGDADAPTAVPDLLAVQQTDTADELDVLGNDSNPTGDTLTIDIIKQPQHATVTPNGSDIIYTITDNNFYGIDRFTYRTTDSQGNKSAATATVFVGKTGNSYPYTLDDAAPLPNGVHTATLSPSGNDGDPDGDGLFVYSVTAPSKGSVANNGGQITYTRDATKYGPDSFTYLVTDGNGGYATANVNIDQVDSDGNGLPDEWENFYFGTTGVDPNADPDGDHLINLQEYQLGTNPTVADNLLTLALSTHSQGAWLAVLYQEIESDPDIADETTADPNINDYAYDPNSNSLVLVGGASPNMAGPMTPAASPPVPPINLHDYRASRGFLANRANIIAVYDYYKRVYLAQPHVFYWAGLARLAGAPVYAGLCDAQDTFLLSSFQKVLIGMNISIVNDIAWQLEAYRQGGLAEIMAINDSNPGLLDGNAIAAWQEIDEGTREGDADKVLDGNMKLLHREQWQTLADGYTELSSDFFLLSVAMSTMSQNPVWGPIPLDPVPFLLGDFDDVVPFGYLPDDDDRWDWITTPPTGIWPAWTSRFDWDKALQVKIWLRVRAFTYSNVGVIW